MKRVEILPRRLSCYALLFVGIGCGTGDAASPGGWSASGPGSGASGTVSGDGGSVVAGMGLPCDIAAILQSKCVACHSSPPAGGAPMPMETYADLTAPARSNSAVTVAELSLTRMQSTTAPMPPPGNTAPTAQEIAAFQTWVNAGTPQGTCGNDAGAVTSPYSTPLQCSSATTWTGGTDGNSRMKPGGACVSCHAQSGGEAPIFSIAGTVYKTAHEPDDCNGAGGSGATVVVTDANNNTLTIPVNGAGNFYSSQAVAKPFHAKVVYAGRERAMSAAQTSGDCNSCHTVNGTMSAPGRIMLP